MTEPWFIVAAILLLITGALHSYLGERLLIGPLLARGDGVLAHHQARTVLRFAWHLTSASWLALAAILIFLGLGDAVSVYRVAAIATGAVFIGAGVLDAIVTRGRHVGWPLLTAIGAAALASLFA